MKVAIIGAGISGLMAASKLQEKAIHFKLFEANDYLGGHVRTLKYPIDKNQILPVELGTIMHDPLLMHPLLNEYAKNLEVQIEEFPLTFSFCNKKTNFYWNTQSKLKGSLRHLSIFLNSAFRNLRRGTFSRDLSFFMELREFLRSEEELSQNKDYRHMSIQEYLDRFSLSKSFYEEWLLPQLICWWGSTEKEALSSSIQIVADSMHKVSKATQYMFTNGWSSFIEKIAEPFKDKIHLNMPVNQIRREDGIEIRTQGGVEKFDSVLLAIPPSAALSILEKPSQEEAEVLKKFTTTETEVYLHNDPTWMPEEEKWSTVNLIRDNRGRYCTFWVGGIRKHCLNLFLTWGNNLSQLPQNEKILLATKWLRTLPTVGYTHACREINQLQGKNRTWYCGAYVHALQENPSSLWHENALISGLNAAKNIGEVHEL